MRIGAFLSAAAGTMIIVRAEAEPIVLSPDKSIPLSIDAKHADIKKKEKIAIFSDVQVSQGDMHWRCKSVTPSRAGGLRGEPPKAVRKDSGTKDGTYEDESFNCS
jgi:lipopolysaccharide export system protein LptA